jgi:hypothetical protein
MLDVKKLRDIVLQINSDKNKNLYSSRWYALVTFLVTNTGLKVARIARPGSVAKLTEKRTSDLDIIFCLSPDKPRKDLYPQLESRFKTQFGSVANITSTPEAIHFTYKDVKGNFDVILLNQADFDTQFPGAGVRDINQIDPIHLDAIKLVKWGLDKNAILPQMNTAVLEKAVFSVSVKDLVTIVEKSVFGLQNPIQSAKRKPEDIMKMFR